MSCGARCCARDPFDFAQGRLFPLPEKGYAQDALFTWMLSNLRLPSSNREVQIATTGFEGCGVNSR